MKKIKYRAWDNEHNKYYKPTYEAYRGKVEDIHISPCGDVTMRKENGFYHESVFHDRFVVEQFTGLHDKNGKEIYDGDIVRLYDRYLDESWKAVIVFGNCNSMYSWGWQLMPISKTSFNIDILLWIDTEDGTATCEVIGNIHEKGDQ